MKKITSLQYDWNFLTLVECKIVTLKHFGESRLRGFTIEYLWYSDHYHWQQSKICAVTTISNNCTKLLRWLPWPPCRSQLPFVVVKIAVVVLFSFVLATATLLCVWLLTILLCSWLTSGRSFLQQQIRVITLL